MPIACVLHLAHLAMQETNSACSELSRSGLQSVSVSLQLSFPVRQGKAASIPPPIFYQSSFRSTPAIPPEAPRRLPTFLRDACARWALKSRLCRLLMGERRTLSRG